MAIFNRVAAISRGHQLYTSPKTLKDFAAAHAANDNYDSRGKPCTWPTEPGNWLTSKSIRRAKVDIEEPADWAVWIGARLAAANDNAPTRPVARQENDGPDADYRARQANPGATREYEGDILSRLVDEQDFEAAFVLRAVGQLMTPTGMAATNDNFADDADVEMGDGFGLDYAIDEPSAESVIDEYDQIGKISGGHLKFRQRSGAGGCSLTAVQRKDARDGMPAVRYLALRGVAELPAQEFVSDGETPWWRSHAPKNAAALADLAAACERTERNGWSRVTWTRYAPMGARVYGDLSVFCTAKGGGDCGATAPEHSVVQEIRRSDAEKALRERLSARTLRLIEAAIARNTYTEIASAESMSRNGVKKAMKSALKEAWAALTRITGEKMPELKEKLAA
ncbi:sigma-70 family RNA polymerase sigma factor [Mesorhizobium sp. INR15]|uniref:sigma-70 family RNA polymerase sigma factor n=1 Tax=Mesorhizobium sp. INR15 TaxID=2654248 RepID=UPI001896A128|nr:sigma-70 family RNA polymerase sigma factor [Mesorhizobium sp. INR15]QPC90300.1 hypothetical protein GA829_06685 [Mesorhizobium sp. INR15]